MEMNGTNWMGGESVSKSFANAFRGRDKNEIKALMYTDLSGDESNLSFLEQFKSGDLKDKSFYNGIKMNEDGTVAEEEISRILNSKKLSLDLLGKFVGNISDMSYNNAAVNPDVAINLEYRRLQNETMRTAINKAKGAGKGEGDDVVKFKDYEYINWYGDSKLTGPEATKMRQDIADREDVLNRYTWKEDHWYDMQEEVKIGDNDDLAKEMNIQDPRFYNIAAGSQAKSISSIPDEFASDIKDIWKYQLTNDGAVENMINNGLEKLGIKQTVEVKGLPLNTTKLYFKFNGIRYNVYEEDGLAKFEEALQMYIKNKPTQESIPGEKT